MHVMKSNMYSPEVSYDMTMIVTKSWDLIKQVPNYRNVVGELIYMHVFSLASEAKALFDFDMDEDLRANPRFYIQARTMVDMIEATVDFLGPDLDILTEDLIDLGERHLRYGVTADVLPVMKGAWLYAFGEVLGRKFTRERKMAWSKIFDFTISKMALGMK